MLNESTLSGNFHSLNNGTTATASADTFFTRIFWGWVACHILLWTVIPALVQPNLPLDAIEMLYIGHEWPLGHFKHPTLPAWLAEMASVLTGNSQWAIYLLSQLAVGACFWAAWRLGREVLSPRLAIIAAALLEGCCYYNFKSTEFNNNLGMYPFWALAILFLYWGIHREKKRYWIAVGISLGLGMLAKYATGVLVVTMLLYMIVDPAVRHWWRRPGPYLTILSAILVFSPNLYWVLTSGFGPIEFAINRTTVESSNVLTRLTYPFEFAGSQILALLPLLVVALPMIILAFLQKKEKRTENDKATRRFLCAMVIWPLIIHMLISAVGNLHLRSMYGSQLWTFFGVWLLYVLNLDESDSEYRSVYRRVTCGIIIISVIFILIFTVRSLASPTIRKKISRTHFPGKELAAEAHKTWGEVSDRPLPVVAGQWWPAANVGFYGPVRTTVYGGSDPSGLDFATEFSAWTNDENLKKSGGIIVWLEEDSDEGAVILEKQLTTLKERFPSLRILPPLELQPNTMGDVPPVHVGMGVLAPPKKN